MRVVFHIFLLVWKTAVCGILPFFEVFGIINFKSGKEYSLSSSLDSDVLYKFVFNTDFTKCQIYMKGPETDWLYSMVTRSSTDYNLILENLNKILVDPNVVILDIAFSSELFITPEILLLILESIKSL
jgi:hypothetical protein